MVSNDNHQNPETKREISILRQMKLQTQSKTGKASRQRVSELKANKQVERLELVVLRLYPRRLVNSSNFTGSLAAACGRDETGIVGIVLWGEQVKQVKTGDIIRIENGWCRSRNGELVVSTGRTGSLLVIDR
jgi:ssDNA-binding replication factor A large subunit